VPENENSESRQDHERSREREEMIQTIIETATERKGHRVVCIDVKGHCSYTDAILIVSGESDRQVQAIGDRISREMRDRGWKPLSLEGGRGRGGWVLLDFGDVVVHVFREDLREFYDLEGLWVDAEKDEISG